MINPRLLQLLSSIGGGNDQQPPPFNPTGDVQQPQGAPPNKLTALAADATGSDNASPFSKINYDTPALRNYQSFISQPPPQVVPSRGQRILAGIAGMGAGVSPVGMANGAPVGMRFDPRAADEAQYNLLQKPNDIANARFDKQAGLLGKSADIEEHNINNQREIARDIENDKIRQQNADQAGDKIQKIYETKQAELEAKIKKTQDDLAEKVRESDAKNKTAEERAQTYKDALEMHRQIAAATAELQKAKAERDQQLNDAKIKKMQDDAEAAAKRAKIAEDALAAKNAPKVVTKEETKPISILGRIGKFTGLYDPGADTKKTTTTTTTMGKIGEPVEVPAGAKPGGKWVDTRGGKKVYVEP